MTPHSSEEQVGDLPIDETVGLLNLVARRALEELSATFPDHRDILRPGVVAEHGKKAESRRVRAAASLAAVSSVLLLIENLQNTVQRRIFQSRRVETVAQALAIITGASVWSSIPLDYASWAKALTGLVALAAALLLYYSKRIQSRPTGSGSILEGYVVLVGKKTTALHLRDDLDGWVADKCPEDGRERLIGQSNQFCRELREFVDLLSLGGTSTGAEHQAGGGTSHA